MNVLVMNILFTIIWAALSGSFRFHNLLFGFVVSLLALGLIREQVGSRGVLYRSLKFLMLFLSFLGELAMSALRVARLVLQPKMDLKPGIFAYELRVKRDFEITLLANLITLTPGTLSVDVSDDLRFLYVHALDCSDLQAVRADIRDGFERRIMEGFSP